MLTGSNQGDYIITQATEDGDTSRIILPDGTQLSPVVGATLIIFHIDGDEHAVFEGYAGCLPNGVVVVAITEGDLPDEAGAIFSAKLILEPYTDDDAHHVDDFVAEVSDEDSEDEDEDEDDEDSDSDVYDNFEITFLTR